MERLTMFLDWKNQYWFKKKKRGNFRFSATPIKIPMAFFTEGEQKLFKFVQKQIFKYPKQS